MGTAMCRCLPPSMPKTLVCRDITCTALYTNVGLFTPCPCTTLSSSLPQAICDAQYRIIAWTMNCPGSQNDRTAFKFSGFSKLLEELPEGYFILGDAAYPAPDHILVPFPGTSLSVSQDAFNYYQSQSRMAIEQTFGILVSVWK